MALGLTPTIAICLTAGVAAGVALARPDDSSSTADTRYESTENPDDASGAGDPTYGGPPASAAPDDATNAGTPDAGGADDGGGAVEIAAITIADFDFSGQTSVAPGTPIEVTNRDGATHTLTSRDDLFDTGQLGQDGSASLVAPEAPGEYAFFCEIHPSMQGTLVVG